MRLTDIITKHPRISADDLVSKARAIMRKGKIRALPVFKNDKLIGVITRSDIIKITSTKTNITVGGLLWKPLVKADSNSNINDVVKILLRNKIKQVPVFENNKYIGLVRDIDLLRAFVESGSAPKKKQVYHVMKKGVRSFSVKDPISKIWAAMPEHSGFPVLDKNKVVGIITSREITDSKKARLSRASAGGKSPIAVSNVMKTIAGAENRLTVKSDESVDSAVKKLLEADASILPVVDTNLVGIVTKQDLLRGYVK